jgi:hypothetical protein
MNFDESSGDTGGPQTATHTAGFIVQEWGIDIYRFLGDVELTKSQHVLHLDGPSFDTEQK